MNILIIDDNTELRCLLSEFLQEKGFVVYQASNGKVGIDILAVEKIDFVISDIQMPIMNGYDFLVSARKRFGNQLPIYLISGYSPYTEEQIYEAGANGYFEKPFDIDHLLHNLRKAV